MTIICVDDHSIMLKGLLKIIQELVPNAIVGACPGADEAMAFAKEHGCDILISEIELAGIDGSTVMHYAMVRKPKTSHE